MFKICDLVIWTQPSGPLCLWQCFLYKTKSYGNSSTGDLKSCLTSPIIYFEIICLFFCLFGIIIWKIKSLDFDKLRDFVYIFLTHQQFIFWLINTSYLEISKVYILAGESFHFDWSILLHHSRWKFLFWPINTFTS